jgi:prepilin-type N-terminal cleavage/methylation domain-containing protein
MQRGHLRMLHKVKNRKQEGFTIIEVLIVLAIAGLILLIVFLAVPALQRNARNTTRKSEVAAILGAVNEWTNNNNGVLPATAAEDTAALANAKLQEYNGNVTWNAGAKAALTSASVDAAVIDTKAACGAGGAAVAGSSRQVAVQYFLETGNGTGIPSCSDE